MSRPRTIRDVIEFGQIAQQYQANRAGMQFRAVDALRFARDPDIAQNMEQFTCNHDFVCSGTQYGGDDTSYNGEGRCYCSKCGLDGDA